MRIKKNDEERNENDEEGRSPHSAFFPIPKKPQFLWEEEVSRSARTTTMPQLVVAGCISLAFALRCKSSIIAPLLLFHKIAEAVLWIENYEKGAEPTLFVLLKPKETSVRMGRLAA